MTDFTQHGEQPYIVAAAGPLPGRLLDVGAYDGVTFSMTRQLMLNGWSGVFVEPSPVSFRRLFELYKDDPRATLVNAAVGPDWALSPLHYTDGMVCTLDDGCFDAFKGSMNYLGTFYVPVVPLGHLLDRFGPFDVISIDAEGKNAELFPVALEHAPRVLAIEHVDYQSGGAHRKHLGVFKRQAAGYRTVLQDNYNLVLARA